MVDIKSREQKLLGELRHFSCVIIQQVIDSSSDSLDLFQRQLSLSLLLYCIYLHKLGSNPESAAILLMLEELSTSLPSSSPFMTFSAASPVNIINIIKKYWIYVFVGSLHTTAERGIEGPPCNITSGPNTKICRNCCKMMYLTSPPLCTHLFAS